MANGYDNVNFLNQDLLDRADLQEMGISDESHLTLLCNELHNNKTMEGTFPLDGMGPFEKSLLRHFRVFPTFCCMLSAPNRK